MLLLRTLKLPRVLFALKTSFSRHMAEPHWADLFQITVRLSRSSLWQEVTPIQVLCFSRNSRRGRTPSLTLFRGDTSVMRLDPPQPTQSTSIQPLTTVTSHTWVSHLLLISSLYSIWAEWPHIQGWCFFPWGETHLDSPIVLLRYNEIKVVFAYVKKWIKMYL